MILLKRGALLLVAGVAGLALTACGDPAESVPQAPVEEVGGMVGGETEYEFNVIVLPNGTKETKTVTKAPTATAPRVATPPKPVPPKVQPPAYKPAPAPAPVKPAPAPAPRR
jgi:hypothetical protein